MTLENFTLYIVLNNGPNDYCFINTNIPLHHDVFLSGTLNITSLAVEGLSPRKPSSVGMEIRLHHPTAQPFILPQD